MNSEGDQRESSATPDRVHLSRLQLLIDLVTFQFKLALDGLRDIALIPLSIVAAVLGLVAGGDRPDQYFQKVVRFGQRTEVWINLFGDHREPGTADDLVDPLRTRVVDEAQANPWLNKAGTNLNRQLDGVNSALTGRDQGAGRQPTSGEPPGATRTRDSDQAGVD